MIKEGTFYFYLAFSIIWFYVGSIIVWRFAIPELYRLLFKKEDFSKAELLRKEQEQKEKKLQKKNR